jgi:hypothetical protein
MIDESGIRRIVVSLSPHNRPKKELQERADGIQKSIPQLGGGDDWCMVQIPYLIQSLLIAVLHTSSASLLSIPSPMAFGKLSQLQTTHPGQK